MSSKLILNIPHSSTRLTGMNPFPRFTNWATGAAFMQMLQNELLPMTDWYTDELFINGIGEPIIATISRVICDTERFRNDEDEPMSKIGMGVCYRTTHDLKRTWNPSYRKWVLENIYDVHHKKLEEAVDQALSKYNKALILDCHSFSPIPLPYEPDKNPDRPDICIGTDPFHTPEELTQNAEEFFKGKGYSLKINSPYSGTIVPLKHLNRDRRVSSLMIELNRGLYLKEGTNQKNDYFPTLKGHLKEFEQFIVSKFMHQTRIIDLGLAKADDPIFSKAFITTIRRVSDFTGKAGGGSTLTAVPNKEGFSVSLCQGLPGCDAPSVLTLDIASRSHEGVTPNRTPQNSPEFSA